MTSRRTLLTAVVAAAIVPAACATPTPRAPVVLTSEQWRQAQAAFLVRNAGQRGWTTTSSGLRYRRLKAAPAAARPSPGDTVTLHYVGRLTDGRVFDSSRVRGEPATFPLGRLIKGWQEGVPMMRVGETWAFVIPPELAYGDRTDRDPIAPGSVLRFEIELIAIVPPI